MTPPFLGSTTLVDDDDVHARHREADGRPKKLAHRNYTQLAVGRHHQPDAEFSARFDDHHAVARAGDGARKDVGAPDGDGRDDRLAAVVATSPGSSTIGSSATQLSRPTRCLLLPDDRKVRRPS